MSAPASKPNRPSTAARHFALERAIRESNLTSTQRLVLYTIAGHATYKAGHAVAYPAVATIALESGLAPRSVNRVLIELVEAGWLKIEPRANAGMSTSNVYTIAPPTDPMPDTKRSRSDVGSDEVISREIGSGDPP
jgi:hypothetical protein